MIDEATKKFKIDTKNSYLIGDRTTDIQMGKNAGCTTILVKTGNAGNDGRFDARPDHACTSLLEACRLVVKLAGREVKA